MTGAVLFAFGCVVLVAWAQVRRGRHRRALPYVSKRILGLLIITAWVVIVTVAVLGELIPSSSALPTW